MRAHQQGADATADERVLAAASCDDLTETLAVAISLAIGPPQGGDPSLATATAAPAAEQESPVGVEESESVRAARASTSAPLPSAFALLVADVGSLPHPALGAGLGLELAWARLRVQLGAVMFYPQRASWQADADVGADLGLTIGIARACMPVLRSRSASLTVPSCLGMELGRMDGVGEGVSGARARDILWIAPRAEAGLAWARPGSPLSLETSLGVVLPLNRDQFIFDGMGAIHRPSRVAGRLCASLNLAFQ